MQHGAVRIFEHEVIRIQIPPRLIDGHPPAASGAGIAAAVFRLLHGSLVHAKAIGSAQAAAAGIAGHVDRRFPDADEHIERLRIIAVDVSVHGEADWRFHKSLRHGKIQIIIAGHDHPVQLTGLKLQNTIRLVRPGILLRLLLRGCFLYGRFGRGILRRRLFRGVLRRGFRYGFRICRFLHGVLFPAQLQDQLDRQRHANQQDQACSHSKHHGLSIARLFLSGSDRAAGSASAAVHIPIVIAVNRRLGGTEHILTAADRHPALAAEIPRRRELRPAVFAISFHFFSSHSFCLSRLL